MTLSSKWPPGGHIGFFGFRTWSLVWLWIPTPNFSGTALMYMGRSLTLIWLWISTPNFRGTILMYMGRSLFDFQLRHFQNGRLAAIWDFSVSRLGRRHGFRTISRVCFGISNWNFMCMLMVVIGRSLLIVSDVTFKMAAWQPYWIFWFQDSNFNLALNINSKLQWHNTYVYGWEPIDFQLL